MKKLIEVKKITKNYKVDSMEFKALKGITFFIDSGEMVAIIGPSGSGKSTLMHLLGALDKPTSGTYILEGHDVSSLDEDELAEIRNKKIGFVFQSFNLLHRTSIRENVELPLLYSGVSPKEREKRAIEALKSVGIEDKKDNHPNQLSGGQMQRAAVARALITQPSIILADEPTGNLDSKRSHEIMQTFCDLNNKGRTIVLITHELELAEYCKRIITLRDGLIVNDEINKKRTS
jgi:putative ABC transport system ATP-binding protein